VVLENFFIIIHLIFAILWLSPPFNRTRSFIWINLNSLHLRMIFTKFNWNWLASSGKVF
jgi:hypothetical protein